MKSVSNSLKPLSFQFKTKQSRMFFIFNTHYSNETHKSYKTVMITSRHKVHPKCDCLDGSIANGIREQIPF